MVNRDNLNWAEDRFQNFSNMMWSLGMSNWGRNLDPEILQSLVLDISGSVLSTILAYDILASKGGVTLEHVESLKSDMEKWLTFETQNHLREMGLIQTLNEVKDLYNFFLEFPEEYPFMLP